MNIYDVEEDIRQMAGYELTAKKTKGWWTAVVYVEFQAGKKTRPLAIEGKADRSFIGAVEKSVNAAKRYIRDLEEQNNEGKH